MLVFNNQQRSGYEEISSYGPKFYNSIKEMDAIYRFAGWTLDIMAADLENLVSFQYVKYMNEEALTREEEFIGIKLDESKTIAERKTIVAANLSSSGKMSGTKIRDIVNMFVECDCIVTFDGTALTINMLFKDDPRSYMDEIRYLIGKAISAHIEVVYKGRIDALIIFAWKNKVDVDKTVLSMNFVAHGAGDGRFLDGSSILDGSMYLDHSSDIYPVTIGNRISVKNTEDITNRVVVRHNLSYLDGGDLLDGNRKVDAYIREEDL